MLGVNVTSVIRFTVNECCNWRRTLGWKVALKGHGFSRAVKRANYDGALAPQVLTQARPGGKDSG